MRKDKTLCLMLDRTWLQSYAFRATAILILFVTTAAAQVVQRDSTGVMSLSTAITRMGGLPPQDSTALAVTTNFNGSSTSSATVTFLTRGMDQTSEQFSGATGAQTLVFSQDNSNDKSPHAKPNQDPWSFELSLTAQSPFFPLPWLASRYANTDISIENVGTDTQAGVPATHLRLTNTFASQPILKHYSDLTRCDVWLDSTTGLPVRIMFERRDSGGAGAGIPITYEYADYRNVQGFLYPFHVKKFVNGTLWADVTVQSVSINSGVASGAFQLN